VLLRALRLPSLRLPLLSLPVLGLLYGMAFAMPPGWADTLGLDWTPYAWCLHLILGALVIALAPGTTSGFKRFLQAWLFCWVWFTCGLAWLTVSMHVYGGMPAWMALASLLAFSAYLALYPAVAIAAIWATPAGLTRCLVAAGSFMVMEWLRGLVFTGFPWLSPGYGQIDGPLAGLAPAFGVFALGAAAWACSTALHGLWVVRGRSPGQWAVLLATPLVAWAITSGSWTTPSGTALRVALVQGQVAQEMKFDPARVVATMTRYTEQVEALSPAHDLIVLPETAWTTLWRNTPEDLTQRWSKLSTTIALGIPDVVQGNITNSVLLLRSGNVEGRYDKHHLVPFGEFVPWGFRWFVDAMHIPLGDFYRGSPLQRGVQLGNQTVAFNICYEDLFGEELAAQLRTHPSTSLLINVSNLAWFGHSHALPQHLQIARMRALELGRPMLRATNTGVTAAIGPDGRVVAALGLREAAHLPVALVGTQGLTPYARFGNTPAILAAIMSAVLLALARRRGPSAA
jgi:apolipoprotein N-acyltransferase